MKKILVVDDEPAIATLLEYNLQREHYEVTVAGDGEEALRLGLERPFDFIILDLMLPNLDGFEVTKKLRAADVTTPILILTAKDSETDKILGLELGADDYVTKPFSPREILARIKAIERRVSTRQTVERKALQVGELHMNLLNHHVKFAGRTIQLTPREYDLLAYFAKHPGQVVSRETLLDHVWGFDYAGQTRMVDMQVSKLRDKLETDPHIPRYLKTVRGYGYKFEEPSDE